MSSSLGGGFATGGKANIGTSAVKLVDTSFRCTQGIQVYAGSGNAEHIWIGASGFSVSSSGTGTDGFPLGPGETLLLQIKNPEHIWVRSTSTANQSAWWFMA